MQTPKSYAHHKGGYRDNQAYIPVA